METLFECRYTPSEERMKETCAYAAAHTPHTWFAEGVWLVIVGFLAFYAVQEPLYWGPVVLLEAFWIWTTVRRHRRFVKQSVESRRGIADGDGYFPLKATETSVRYWAGTCWCEIDYSRLRCAKNLRRTVLVISKGGIILDFPKDSFTKGTPEEFLALLRQKGVRVK